MKVNRVSGQVLSGPFEPVYVYEAPVRFWHWAMMLCMILLAGTGYLIGAPLPAIGGEATFSYFFANIRMIHFIAAMLFAVLFLVRIVWVFMGNRHARSIFVPPLWSGEWWSGCSARWPTTCSCARSRHHWSATTRSRSSRCSRCSCSARSSSSSPAFRSTPSSTAGARRG